MLPKTHTILAFIFAGFLILAFGISFFQALIIFLSAIFIDVDHYLYYVYRQGDWSLRNSFRWYIKKSKEFDKKRSEGKKLDLKYMHVFHTVEFNVILAFLSYYSSFFLYVLIGFLFHSLLDLCKMILKRDNSREFFLIRYLVSNKKRYV